jgi:hypothetical protein
MSKVVEPHAMSFLERRAIFQKPFPEPEAIADNSMNAHPATRPSNPIVKAVEYFIMSFGANLHADEETHWVSEYDGIDNFNKAVMDGDSAMDDSTSETTDVGSADSLADLRTESCPTSKSHEEFWHFYRSADSLADMLRSTDSLMLKGFLEEVDATVQQTSGCSSFDYWKLPLEPLPSFKPVEDAEEIVETPPSQARAILKSRMATSCVGSRRTKLRVVERLSKTFKRSPFGSKLEAQDANQMFTVLAEQIY